MKTLLITLSFLLVSITGYTQANTNNFDIQVPNAFTPDGDGLNDTFYPYVWGHKSIDLYIFNRLGQLIYSESNGNGWDGKFREKECEQSVYVWQICVTDSSNISHNYIGTVTLLRVK